MYQGQDSVGQSSDGVTNTSGSGFNLADFSASVWSSMQSDSQSRTSGASSQTRSSEASREASASETSREANSNETSREASVTQSAPLQLSPNTVAEHSRERQSAKTQPIERSTQSPPDRGTPGDTRPSGPGIPPGADSNVMQADPSARDKSSLPDLESPSALTSRQLYERFEEQDRRIGNEFLNSPMQRRLTPQYHELAQQRIRDADNLPHARLRSEAEQGNQRAFDLHNRIERTNGALHQASTQSPELRELVPNLLQSIDSPRWEHLAGNQENMARLRQIAPHVADTLDTRRELGRQQLNQSELWETNRLLDLPMRARFDYANTLVETGGGEEQKAVRYLTEMLNARPESLNYGIRGYYGQINFGDLAVRSGALHSKGFLAALGRAGGSPDRLLREYNHRFPPELRNR